MTQLLAALDALAARVLAYRPKDKGLAAKKTARKIARAEKQEDQDDARESSI